MTEVRAAPASWRSHRRPQPRPVASVLRRIFRAVVIRRDDAGRAFRANPPMTLGLSLLHFEEPGRNPAPQDRRVWRVIAVEPAPATP